MYFLNYCLMFSWWYFICIKHLQINFTLWQWPRISVRVSAAITKLLQTNSTVHQTINNTILNALPPESTFNISVNTCKCTVPACDDSLFFESHIFHWPHTPAWLSDLQHQDSWLVCTLIFSWELLWNIKDVIIEMRNIYNISNIQLHMLQSDLYSISSTLHHFTQLLYNFLTFNAL